MGVFPICHSRPLFCHSRASGNPWRHSLSVSNNSLQTQIVALSPFRPGFREPANLQVLNPSR
ncbi:hypothetical protein OMAG_000330 [Candidatus Omnitrophus magneticus]|uniref:Uncharacterized protein n=1 Tax=Candidatus Omnitrophus magneticus TaxID=1609969 RepID=A0A0F0CR52_9BACT|nr:hypothetical protein OMAG_000330 [Candidatus Omnitrophus magneticus]